MMAKYVVSNCCVCVELHYKLLLKWVFSLFILLWLANGVLVAVLSNVCWFFCRLFVV